jgi:hypothetical protein
MTERRPESLSWTIHGERMLYDNPWVRLVLVDVEPPNGERFEHHVVRLGRIAIALVVDDQDQVLTLWRTGSLRMIGVMSFSAGSWSRTRSRP